jgi:hypothetical protein
VCCMLIMGGMAFSEPLGMDRHHQRYWHMQVSRGWQFCFCCGCPVVGEGVVGGVFGVVRAVHVCGCVHAAQLLGMDRHHQRYWHMQVGGCGGS